jgi:hypothetical protein
MVHHFMGAQTRRFTALLNSTSKITADKVGEELPHNVAIATITSLLVDQTLTLATQLQLQA